MALEALERKRLKDTARRNRESIMHTIKPIDEIAIMRAIRDMGRIVTVEDHTVIGGLGSAVADVIAKSGKACALRCLGLQDEFAIIGSPDDLLRIYGLDAHGIQEKVKELLKAERK